MNPFKEGQKYVVKKTLHLKDYALVVAGCELVYKRFNDQYKWYIFTSPNMGLIRFVHYKDEDIKISERELSIFLPSLKENNRKLPSWW